MTLQGARSAALGITRETAVATERAFLSVTGLKGHGGTSGKSQESKVETTGEVRDWLQ